MSACDPIRRERRSARRLGPLIMLLGCACSLEPDYPSEDPLADCGDGQVGTEEECDDGNRDDGDGCSAECLKPGSAVWTRTFDGPSGAADCSRGIALTPDGNIVVVGLASAGETGQDMWIAVLTPEGELLWTRTTDGGAAYIDALDDVGLTADGTIYVAGTKYSSATQVLVGDEDVWVEALSADGERLWSATMDGGPGVSSYAQKLAVDESGVVVVGAQRMPVLEQLWSFKLDARGKLLWEFVGDSDLEARQLPGDVALSPEHDAYIIGYTSGVSSEEKRWLSRRSSTGDKIWTREIGVASAEDRSAGAALAIDAKGHLWLAYEIPGSGETTDVQIERRAADGTLEFSDIYRGPADEDDGVLSVAIAPTGAVVLGGYSEVDSLNPNTWLQVHEPDGAVAWTRVFGGDGNERSSAVTADASHVYATGCVVPRWRPSDVWTAQFTL